MGEFPSAAYVHYPAGASLSDLKHPAALAAVLISERVENDSEIKKKVADTFSGGGKACLSLPVSGDKRQLQKNPCFGRSNTHKEHSCP